MSHVSLTASVQSNMYTFQPHFLNSQKQSYKVYCNSPFLNLIIFMPPKLITKRELLSPHCPKTCDERYIFSQCFFPLLITDPERLEWVVPLIDTSSATPEPWPANKSFNIGSLLWSASGKKVPKLSNCLEKNNYSKQQLYEVVTTTLNE